MKKALQYDIILDKLLELAHTYETRQRLKKMDIFDGKEELIHHFHIVEEAMDILRLEGRLPIDEISSIDNSLSIVNMDGTLSIEELSKIMHYLQNLEALKSYFENEYDYKYLRDYVETLQGDTYLLKELERCIHGDDLYDHASSELYHLRKQKISIQSRIHTTMNQYRDKYKNYLSIENIATRNDHYVLAVKNDHKNKVKGVVHAVSGTGSTSFIEPEEVMLMNNEYNALLSQEQEEIRKICFQLSQRIKRVSTILHYDYESLVIIDYYFSKARLGQIYHSCIPEISNEKELIFKQARHPLLNQETIVPNDIIIDKKMLLISGSNTGGKTVALKTIGLLTYMALLGLPIPATSAKLPLYDKIFVDIGDNQSIEESLSTYSSHMKSIISILKNASSHSLVIIDEIGSGTDPQEGSNLAKAIIDQLLENDTTLVISTHYGDLKAYASLNDDIRLASVEFHIDEMKPTYKLIQDSIGSSYAFEIAQSLGLSKEIIHKAKDYQDQSLTDTQKKLIELTENNDHLFSEIKTYESLIEENEKLKESYERKLERIETRREKMIQETQEEINKMYEDAKTNIKEIQKNLKNERIKDHHITNATRALDELKTYTENTKESQNVKVGDRVLIDRMNREGDVISIHKHVLTISVDGLPVKVKDNEVTFKHAYTKPKKVKARTHTSVKKTGHYEVNIIGMRYVEAMETVEKFIDDALLLGYPSVKIIHGMGTGALRKGVRELIKKNKHISSFTDGGPNEGGLGATIIHFE